MGTATSLADGAISALNSPVLWVFMAIAAILGGIGTKWPWALGVAILAAILASAISTYSRATAAFALQSHGIACQFHRY